MQSMQIINGFSDMKSQFIRKTKTTKATQELELWFTQTDDALYMHDKAEHKTNMLIALKIKNQWVNRLEQRSMAARLLNSHILKANSGTHKDMASALNDEYLTGGFLLKH
jgi:hypothetical protein